MHYQDEIDKENENLQQLNLEKEARDTFNKEEKTMTGLKQDINFKRSGVEYLIEYEDYYGDIFVITINDIEAEAFAAYFIDVVVDWIQEELISLEEDDGQNYADYLYHTNKEY